MAYAVQEINRNSTLLPGVKLGYRVLNNCGRYPWALQDALSLVSENSQNCNLTASVSLSAAYGTLRDTGGMTFDIMKYAVDICYVHENMS